MPKVTTMDTKDKPIIQLEDGWREIKQIALDPLEVSELTAISVFDFQTIL